MHKRYLISALAVLALLGQNLLQAQTTVTLTVAAAPTAGQAGLTNINLTGFGFPAGTILPANVNVSLQPAAGGAVVMTKATAVTTISGTTRRVSFTVPATITVATPTPYNVSISGMTSTGIAFASSNASTLTVNPAPKVSSLSPTKGQVGQTLTVTITGQYTNFVQGVTQANFGAGISVGGAAENTLGPVTVTSPTTARAQLIIRPAAATGARTVTVQNGGQLGALARGFAVIGVTAGPNVNVVSNDPYSQKQVEVDAAANPLNPNHIFTGFIDYQTVISEPLVNGSPKVSSKGMCGFSFSTNGGKTWKNGLVDVGDPADVAKCGDPSVAWDTSGHAFFFGLVQLSDPNSTTLMYTWRFRDPDDGSGQLIPEARVLVDSPAFVGEVLDKNALIFQPDATPGGSPNAPGTLYACYVSFDETQTDNPSDVRCAISRDGGLHYSKNTAYNKNLRSNNGSVMAPAPNGGIYLFWRAFSDAENGHYFVKVMPDGSATDPVRVVGGAGFYPYDAPSRDDLARSEGFSSVASDGNQKVFLTFQAYSDSTGRMAPSSPSNSPRIFGTYTTDGGVNWSTPAAIDYGPHPNTTQFMQRTAQSGGVFSVIYYDGRNDRCYDQEPSLNTCSNFGGRPLNGPYTVSGKQMYLPTGRDRRFDLRVIQGQFEGPNLVFKYASTQVTRYETRASDHQIVNRNADPINCNAPECAAVNLPFLTVGSSGTLSWMGDYIAHAAKVQFVLNPPNSGLPAWRVANQPTDAHTFLAFWSDFRKVAFPLDSTGKPSINGIWPLFIPASPLELAVQNPICANPESRDVNVVFSEITDFGLSANIKSSAQRPEIPAEFTVNVSNLSPTNLFLRLEIVDSALEDWSTVQTLPADKQPVVPADDNFVDVKVLSNSAIVQTIYYRYRTPGVNPTPNNPVLIKVYEIDKPGGVPIANGLNTVAAYTISYAGTSGGPAHQVLVSDPLVSKPTSRTTSFTRKGQPSNNLIDNNLLDNNLLDNNLLDNNLLDNNLLDNNLLDNNLLDNNLLDNSLVEDLQVVWTTTGGGALSTATRGITNLANGQDLLNAGWKFQLLFYQTQLNPKVFSCTQFSTPTDVLLANIAITKPNTNLLDNFQISNNLLDNNLLDNNLLDNSAISDQVSNATVSVNSNEVVNVALRAYKPVGSTQTLLFFNPTTGAPTDPTQIGEAYIAAPKDPATGNLVADFFDATAPIVIPTIVGSLGTCLQSASLPGLNGQLVPTCLDGWYYSSVSVSWLVTDPQSGILSSVGCGPVSLTNETAGTPITCTATNNNYPNLPNTTSVTITIRIDTIAPDTTITGGPANGSTITSNNPTFSFTGSDPAPSSGGPTFECKVDAAAFSACSSAYALSGLLEGPHTFSVRAKDTAGNVDATPDSRTFTVDTKPPLVNLNIPLPNGGAGYFITSPVIVAISATDTTSKVSSFSCTDNSATVTVGNLSGIGTSTATGSLSVNGDGVHNLICTATDSAGNGGAAGGSSNSGVVNIDTGRPDTFITAGPSNGSTINTTSTSFEFNGTDALSGVAAFECQLDALGYSPCTSPKALTGLTDGTHAFSVRAKDAAGNIDDTPASRTFIVSTSYHLVFVTQPANTGVGGTIAPPVRVAVEDASSNIVAGATTGITLSLASSPGGGMLSGPSASNAVNGIATFSNLSIDKAGNGYTIRATPASTILHFDELPFQPVDGLSTNGVTFGFQVGGVASTDAHYNSFGPAVTTFVQDPSLEGDAAGILTMDFAIPTTNLSFGAALNTNAATLGFTVQLLDTNLVSLGTTAVNIAPRDGYLFSDGNFVYTGVPVRRMVIDFNQAAANRFALDNLMFDSAGSGGISGAISAPFNINTPASITATAGSPQNATVNAAFSTALQATVKDGSTNPVNGVSVTFTATTTGAMGTFPGGLTTATVVTNSSGIATAPAFTANTIAGAYTVTASVAGVVASAVFTLTNRAGAPASITATAGSGQSTTVTTAFPIALQATVKDSFNNPILDSTVTFLAPTSGPSGTFTGGVTTKLVATDNSGVATAPTFTANAIAGSYTVSASVVGVAATANFSLINLPPLNITTTAVSGGSFRVGYSQPLSATGGNGTRTWSVDSGSLPTGLSLSSAGVINGTPTALGTFNFVVKVTNPSNPGLPATQPLSITITYSAGGVIVADGSPSGPGNKLSLVSPGGFAALLANFDASGLLGIQLRPLSAAFDASGNTVVAASGSTPQVDRLSPAGSLSKMFSGTPLSGPVAIATDLAGNIIVGDNATDTIYKINPTGSTITTLATLPPSSANLEDIKIHLDPATGDLIVANDDEADVLGVSAIRRISPAGVVSTIFTGTAIPSIGGLTLDSAGNIIVGSFGGGTGTIYTVTPAGAVSTLVSSSLLVGNLTGLTTDFGGNYIASINGVAGPPTRIVKITPSGSVSTILSNSVLTWANDVTLVNAKVLVDASKDGGGWWFPQSGPFDPNLPHQGKALADALRRQGMMVTELPRFSTISCMDLSQYDLVIVANPFAPAYSASELTAYSGYVSNGGRLILLEDHTSGSNLSSSLGLTFSGSVDGPVTSFTPHPITAGVTTLNYFTGSTVTVAPPTATMLGFLSGLPVMGIMPFGSGRVFFTGDINGIEGVPQPFVNNLFSFMLAGVQPVNACLPTVSSIAFSLDSRSTFLRADTNDTALASPLIINLATRGISPGDSIRLDRIGNYHPSVGSSSFTDSSTSMNGVFSSSATVLPANNLQRVPGAIDAGVDFISQITFFGSLPTDIPEDFFINGGGTVVQVPAGATYLFIGVSDSFYSDNGDPNGDFAVRITRLGP